MAWTGWVIARREIQEAEAQAKGIDCCERCGWPLRDQSWEGCTPNYCSQRPVPPLLSDTGDAVLDIRERENGNGCYLGYLKSEPELPSIDDYRRARDLLAGTPAEVTT